MGIFYQYPPLYSLDGSEIVVLYQDTTKSCTLDEFNEFYFRTLYVNKPSSPNDGDFLIYSVAQSDWINTTVTLNSLSDVNVPTPDLREMLLYGDTGWYNGTDARLGNYTESEYNAGTVATNYTLDLINGNIQRIAPTGPITIYFPDIPTDEVNWNLVVKVIYDGTNTPTFESLDGTVKWYGDEVPVLLAPAGSIFIYLFTSDWVGSYVLASLTWRETI